MLSLGVIPSHMYSSLKEISMGVLDIIFRGDYKAFLFAAEYPFCYYTYTISANGAFLYLFYMTELLLCVL